MQQREANHMGRLVAYLYTYRNAKFALRLSALQQKPMNVRTSLVRPHTILDTVLRQSGPFNILSKIDLRAF